jgi:hypothetical protein
MFNYKELIISIKNNYLLNIFNYIYNIFKNKYLNLKGSDPLTNPPIDPLTDPLTNPLTDPRTDPLIKKIISFKFRTMSGTEIETGPIDYNLINNYDNFVKNILEDGNLKKYLEENELNVDFTYKFVIGDQVIDSENYNEYINEAINEAINISIVFSKLPKIYSNKYAFAIINIDGSVNIVKTSKIKNKEGEFNKEIGNKTFTNNIVKIYSTSSNFAALDGKGNVFTWNEEDEWNCQDFKNVKNRLINIEEIYSNDSAFAAVNNEGEVITWGDNNFGGNSSSVKEKLKNITKIYHTWGAFAAVNRDGEVITWGHNDYGGDSSSVQDRLKNIKEIYSTRDKFAAVNNKNEVITWSFDIKQNNDEQLNLLNINKKEIEIYSTSENFIVVIEVDYKGTKNAIVGNLYKNGEPDTSILGFYALNEENQIKNIEKIYTTSFDYVAVDNNSKVVGGSNSHYSNYWLKDKYIKGIYSNSNNSARVAIDKQGKLILSSGRENAVDDKIVEWLFNQHLENVVSINSTKSAFAALDNRGRIKAWGNPNTGGFNWDSNIIKIYNTSNAFASINVKGEINMWGWGFSMKVKLMMN